MSFRISDNKKLFGDICEKNYADTVIGFAAEGEVFGLEEAIENYLHVRQKSMIEIQRQKNKENWSIQKEQQMYCNNELPEFYFDFIQQSDGCIDNLQVAYQREMAEIHEWREAYTYSTSSCLNWNNIIWSSNLIQYTYDIKNNFFIRKRSNKGKHNTVCSSNYMDNIDSSNM